MWGVLCVHACSACTLSDGAIAALTFVGTVVVVVAAADAHRNKRRKTDHPGAAQDGAAGNSRPTQRGDEVPHPCPSGATVATKRFIDAVRKLEQPLVDFGKLKGVQRCPDPFGETFGLDSTKRDVCSPFSEHGSRRDVRRACTENARRRAQVCHLGFHTCVLGPDCHETVRLHEQHAV